MKRRISFISVMLFLLVLSGCSQSNEEIKVPAQFYYCTAETAYQKPQALITFETRETIHVNQSLTALLNTYLAGPKSMELISPFPGDIRVNEVLLTDGNAHIQMNNAFGKLSGIELTLACACITYTVQDYLDVSGVSFSTESGDIGGQKTIFMTKETLVLMDLAPQTSH